MSVTGAVAPVREDPAAEDPVGLAAVGEAPGHPRRRRRSLALRYGVTIAALGLRS
jgi:hypothetical protein